MYRYLLIALVLFSACSRKYQDCPGFLREDREWTVYSPDDTVRFTNAGGNRISFVIKSATFDPAYSEKCGRGEPMGYYCRPCELGAVVSGKSDSTRHGSGWLRIELTKGDERQPGTLNFSVFDIIGEASFDYETHQAESADFLSNLTLGGTTYHDVYFSSIDTITRPQSVVWKIYYNKQHGILGFEDRQTHSLFYRE